MTNLDLISSASNGYEYVKTTQFLMLKPEELGGMILSYLFMDINGGVDEYSRTFLVL